MENAGERDIHQSVIECHDVMTTTSDEIQFKRRYEEGYDLFDEPYIRWLLVHHPEAVK